MVSQESRKFWQARNLRFWGCLDENRTTIVVKKYVGRLEIAVNYPLHVAISYSRQHLIKKLLHFDRLHCSSTQTVHIGPQIFVKVLEDEIKLFLINDHIFQSEWNKVYVTTFLWSISLRREIYLMEVEGNPSFSISKMTFFIATTSLFLLSMHLKT